MIRNGQYWVDDIRVDQTIHRRDPMFPRWTSAVQALVGDNSGRIHIPDIESQGDLDRIAHGLPQSALPAGGIDFFIAWLQQQCAIVETNSSPHLQGPACIVCGSLAAWKSGRRESADLYGIRTLLLGSQPEVTDKQIGLLAIGDENRLTSGSAQQNDLENQRREWFAHDLESPQALERALARLVIRLQSSNRWKTLFIEGGATARAIVEEFQCDRLVCVGELGPGCTVLKPADDESLTLVVKPGSYPWPKSVWEFVSTANR
jgi:uncharacterized protein YgbK (DUF1537 family)